MLSDLFAAMFGKWAEWKCDTIVSDCAGWELQEKELSLKTPSWEMDFEAAKVEQNTNVQS